MLEIYIKWTQIKGESNYIQTIVKPLKPEEIFLVLIETCATLGQIWELINTNY